MLRLPHKNKEGISLRTLNVCLLMLAVLVSAYMIWSSNTLAVTFQNMSAASDRYIAIQRAAHELLDTTEYMTEMVQRYTLDGNSIYLHNYLDEAAKAGQRKAKIMGAPGLEEESDAIDQLQRAMDKASVLTEREHYAMRLIIEATGLYPVPEELKDIELEPQHSALPAREKKEAAQHMVSDEDYYRELDRIRREMKESLSQLEEKTKAVLESSSTDANNGLRQVRIVMVIQTVGILFIVWLMAHLGIYPILRAVENLRNDSPIPLSGANEFRYLARTYNKMSELYKSSVANLKYKANHDELTMAYNRSGYELLLSNLDLEPCDSAILMADVDYFKSVNDTYGHEVGDEVLKKVVKTITKHFRSEDYVCRIGGDEFVVIMRHVGPGHKALLEEKVARINEALTAPDDGLPPCSLSAGVAFLTEDMTREKMVACADQALYETKRKGRKGISFYGDMGEQG